MDTQSTLCPKCGEMMDKTEKNIREHPDQAALLSVGIGFLLAQLPLRLLMAALVRAVLMVLKPAALLYGFFRLAEDMRNQQAPMGQPNQQ